MQIHGGWMFGYISPALTAISSGEPQGKVRNAGSRRVRGAEHIWLSASHDEWLGDNRASAAGRKMIPWPAVAAGHAGKASSPLPSAPTCHQHLWESGSRISNTKEAFQLSTVFMGEHLVWSHANRETSTRFKVIFDRACRKKLKIVQHLKTFGQNLWCWFCANLRSHRQL